VGSAILLDYENVYWRMKDQYNAVPDPVKLVEGLRQLPQESDVLLFFAYADFDNPEFRGLQSELQRRGVEPRHVFSKHSDDLRRKNSADIEMSLEALELVYARSDIDKFVLVSGDRDMIPIIKRLLQRGKKVHVVSVKSATSKDLRRFATTYTAIEDLLGITPTEPTMLPVTVDDPKSHIIRKLHILESGKMPFVGLSYFTKKENERVPFNVFEVVNELILEGAIETYEVPNPRNPAYPTKACRLDHNHELVIDVLSAQRKNGK